MSIDYPVVGGDADAWGGKVNADIALLDANTAAEVERAHTAETNLGALSTASVDALRAELHATVPGAWTSADTYVAGTHRNYGGSEWVAAVDVPTGIRPNPIGDGSPADRAIVLAGRCGYAASVVGGDAYGLLTVSNANVSGAGSYAQALLDAQAAGGGYIVWAPGTYFTTYPPGTTLLVPSHTTINAHAADVTMAGFGHDDATGHFIGGQTPSDFTGFYGSVPATEIIVTGIKFVSNTGAADSHGDVFAIRFWADNIWIDHCHLTNPEKLTDGLFDITHAGRVTVSWCEFFKHHKAVLAHTKALVSSPTGTQLPPGVDALHPGPYTIQNVGGVDYTAETVTYVHCLGDQLAQRFPEADHDATWLDVAACWGRLFGGYNDGVNATVNGLYNWPTVTGARYAETALPGPSTGPGAPGTSVPGAFVRNSGAATKVNSSGGSVQGAHVLVRGCTYTNLPGDTNIAVRAGGGNFRTDGNTYENATADADVHPERVPNPPYVLDMVAPAALKNALRYGTARNNPETYWTYVGPATTGTVGTVIEQDAISIGAAKVLRFAGSGYDTITYDPVTGRVVVPLTLGAADPTGFLRYGTDAARLAITPGSTNVNELFFTTDKGVLWQVQHPSGYVWRQLTNPYPATSPGTELVAVEYWPSAANGTNASTTSASAQELGALAVTAAWTGNSAAMFDAVFVAPPTGNVEVLVTLTAQVAGGGEMDVDLYDVGAAAIVANSKAIVSNSSSEVHYTYRKRVTGLTAGTTYTFRPRVYSDGTHALTIYSGAAKGPVQVRVLAGS